MLSLSSTTIMTDDISNPKTQNKSGNNISKRQKLKLLQQNELNKFPQQPRIKSAEKRAKADILQSGLGLKPETDPTKLKNGILDPKLDLDSPELKFGRSLASSDAAGRHKSVNQLRFYLKARCGITNESGGLSQLDLMKLWKGLWYCLYMADKVPVQDELSKRLAQLIWCFEGTEEEDEYAARMYLSMEEDEEEEEEDVEGEEDEEVTMKVVKNTLSGKNGKEKDEVMKDVDDDDANEEDDEEDTEDDKEPVHLMKHCRGAHLAALFTRTFFATVRREWGNMDKYRVDKFYTLLRIMMGEIYKYMAKRHWNYGIIRLFNDHLYEEILSQIPNGIRYHMIDLALDQLAIVNKTSAPLPITESTFVEVMEPFFGICQFESNSTVQSRVMEQIFRKFLCKYSVVGDTYLAAKEQEDKENGDNGANDEKKEQDDDDYTMDNVHVGSISDMIFSLASHPETKDKYRESLYDMHKTYEKRIKKVGKDVELDEDDDDDDDEENIEMESNDEEMMIVETGSTDKESDDNNMKDKKQKNLPEVNPNKNVKTKEGTKIMDEKEEMNGDSKPPVATKSTIKAKKSRKKKSKKKAQENENEKQDDDLKTESKSNQESGTKKRKLPEDVDEQKVAKDNVSNSDKSKVSTEAMNTNNANTDMDKEDTTVESTKKTKKEEKKESKRRSDCDLICRSKTSNQSIFRKRWRNIHTTIQKGI